MSTSKSGQASLEMVVGLIILLVVAGVVIGLVMTTMNKDNMNQVTGGPAGKFKANCDAFCETKNYNAYCTSTMENLVSSKDWDSDKQNGRMVKDKDSVWDFCEDSVYCFLVTKCPTMNVDNCRTFMCQAYMEKYGDSQRASAKLKELYKMSNNLQDCYREDKKTSTKTYVADLVTGDNWLLSKFDQMGWCQMGGTTGGSLTDCGDQICNVIAGENSVNCPKSNRGDCYCGDNSCDSTESAANCPSDCTAAICGRNGCEPGENAQNCPVDCSGGNVQNPVSLGGCIYNSTEGSLTCDTTCQSEASGNNTLVIFDGSNMSMVNQKGTINIGATGTDIPIGNLTFSSGKLKATPLDVALISSVSLANLNPASNQWLISINCKNPNGGNQTAGATKV